MGDFDLFTDTFHTGGVKDGTEFPKKSLLLFRANQTIGKLGNYLLSGERGGEPCHSAQ